MPPVRVTLSFRPREPAAFALLRGSWSDFREPIPMTRHGDGSFEATLDLPPGVHTYKLHVEGARWELDPDNPRTRSRGGARDNVLVVEGTNEPILHAPARPDVAREDDGRLRLRAALRRGHGGTLAVRWDEGSGPRDEPMRLVGHEDEHLLFEARLPVSAARVAYVFRLESGQIVGRSGEAAQWLSVAPGALTDRIPAPIETGPQVVPAPSLPEDPFRASLDVAPLPTRLYVTVTERCNLRCAHCITDAPGKTESGRARVLSPWLLDALREPFAHVDYVGFVHGGESLVAPIFLDVLAAIQRARASRPGRADVHLLSNGMLLDSDRFDALADLGVTSLSISLDGATPKTNDGLRIGGHFAAIVRNLSRMIARREARGIDVRIGISTVVTTSNVAELPALGRLATSLGVDWLKIEEIVPCTPRALAERIDPRDARVVQAMAELAAILAPTGVVLVDHLAPKQTCPCLAGDDPAWRAFREADDFANRARFLGCRMEWEQASIDPDGVVHLPSYEARGIGSLASAPFGAIWNGDEARRARREALARIPAETRASCAAAPRRATIVA